MHPWIQKCVQGFFIAGMTRRSLRYMFLKERMKNRKENGSYENDFTGRKRSGGRG